MAEREFQDLFVAPLQRQVAAIEGVAPGARRQFLDAMCPDVLHRRLAEGANEAQRAYAGVLSEGTHAIIHRYLQRARAECDRARPLWDVLDNYDRHGTFDSAKAGLLSEETQLGVAIGSVLLPGIGSILGGAVGGWLAASRMEEQVQRALAEYGAWLEQFLEQLGSQSQAEIWPAVNRDILRAQEEAPRALPAHAPTQGGGRSPWRPIAIVLGLCGVGGLAVFTWRHLHRGAAGAAAIAPASASALADLAGRWRSDAGLRYEASMAEDALSFRLLGAVDTARSGYGPGEVHFRLRERGVTGGLSVETWLRPAAPRGLRYAPAGVADCKVLVTQADGAALGAERSGDGLRVELARLAAPAGLLLGQKGRVVGCRHLGEAKVARQVVTLSRVGPDEAVAATERKRARRREPGEAPRRRADEAAAAAATGEAAPARPPTAEEKTPAAAVQAADDEAAE